MAHEQGDEAVKYGIIIQISLCTMKWFFKGEHSAASSQTVLAHTTTRGSGHTGAADSHDV
jgi:hypothetical protein